MEHLGNSLKDHKRADSNLTAILNPVPAWKKKYDSKQRKIMRMIGGGL